MFEILKLHLQGLSAYKIARKLNLDPPMVYASLKAAKTNFAKADKMLTQLKAQGWPLKLPEVEKQIRNKAQQRQTVQAPPVPQPEEIPVKLG
jgi:hypothetical protein